MNDRLETQAMKAAFGDEAYKVKISSTKSMTGHLLGAAGGVEAAIAALTVSESAIPPTINLAINSEPRSIYFNNSTATTRLPNNPFKIFNCSLLPNAINT